MSQAETTERLQTLGGHQALLHKVLTTAQKRVVIVSPFISIKAIEFDNLSVLIKLAVARGVKVNVYTDYQLNCIDGYMKLSAKEGISTLTKAGAKIAVVNGIHSKTLIRDNDLIADGSFNWLSAVRTKSGNCRREERSLVYTGADAGGMIASEITNLEKMGYGTFTVIPKKVWTPSLIFASAILLTALASLTYFAGVYAGLTLVIIFIFISMSKSSPADYLDPFKNYYLWKVYNGNK
jgi:hypothetical protein